MKLLHKRVLVRPIEKENKTASGIILIDNDSSKRQEAIVVEVAEGVDSSIVHGAKIHYKTSSGRPFPTDEEELLLLEVDDVLSVL